MTDAGWNLRRFDKMNSVTQSTSLASSPVKARTLLLGGQTLSLPIFFPSVSSVKTNLSPLEYVRVLTTMGYPTFLVSAYNIVNSGRNDGKGIVKLVDRAVASGKTVLLDSGNYESYWHRDGGWKEKDFNHALTMVKFSCAFSYDHKTQPKSVSRIVDAIEQRVIRASKVAPTRTIIPIIHAQQSLLPRVAKEVASHLRPLLVAIPERGLGEGVIERTVTLRAIRASLNESGEYYPIHLLGTGNPLSLLLYSIFGADTFDGLEWCQTAVNHTNRMLYHFQQRELFGNQSPFCSTLEIPYAQATMAHNLLFYQEWMKRIRLSIESGNVESLMAEHFSEEFIHRLSTQQRS